MKEIAGPKTLQEAIVYFANEDNAFRTLSALRWPDGIVPCPVCGCSENYFLKTRRVWKCKACAKQFSVKVGTIFEDSPLPLAKWLPAVWLICGAKNGISSYEVARALGVCQKTAWFMLHRIRLAMQNGSFEMIGGKNGTPVEADETFIGGKAKNMHKDKKVRVGVAGGGPGHMETVMGIVERGGKVVTFHVSSAKTPDLVRNIRKTVQPDSHVYTDENVAYVALGNHFRHEMINHAYEYVNGKVHTNSIENYWSLLKRTLKGTYVSVEPFHLFRYLDEQAFRFNERKGTDRGRFELALSQVSGRRITYKQLTGKTSFAGPGA
jgi:transposase-like protein